MKTLQALLVAALASVSFAATAADTVTKSEAKEMTAES